MFTTRTTLRTTLPSLRFYSTPTPPPKPSVKLIAELRKLSEGVSLSKAREALSASNNDVKQALEWVQKDLSISGAKKSAKVEGRRANEGLVGFSVLSRGVGSRTGGAGGIRGAMIELNCETDFVARNDLFGRLLADIAHTAAFITEPQPSSQTIIQPLSLDLLQDAPLISHTGDQTNHSHLTVSTAIQELVSKVGEKVALRRAMTVVTDPFPKQIRDIGLRLGSYAHGSISIASQGRIASLAILALKSPKLAELLASEGFEEELVVLERSLAKQIVGFPTTGIRSAGEEGEALYGQEFMMYPESDGQTVETSLKSWAVKKGLVEEGSSDSGGLEVVEFVKWTVGEPI